LSIEEGTQNGKDDIENEINIDILIGQTFPDREKLTKDVKDWALLKRMNLILGTAERENIKENIKVTTLYCSKKK